MTLPSSMDSRVLLSEDDDVVQAFPSKGPDPALAVGILPRRSGCDQHLLDSHRTHATNEGRAIDLVPKSDSRGPFDG